MTGRGSDGLLVQSQSMFISVVADCRSQWWNLIGIGNNSAMQLPSVSIVDLPVVVHGLWGTDWLQTGSTSYRRKLCSVAIEHKLLRCWHWNVRKGER
jgi:hypothetical protein